MRNRVILCLGSNWDCESNINSADELLREYFNPIHFSESVYTEPVGLPASGLFLNQTVIAYTDNGLEEVKQSLKEMEKVLGRMPDSKEKGQIPIDIDLLLWNNEILKPADWEKEYVQLLVSSAFESSQNDIRREAVSEKINMVK